MPSIRIFKTFCEEKAEEYDQEKEKKNKIYSGLLLGLAENCGQALKDLEKKRQPVYIHKVLKELRRNIHKLKNFDLTYTYSPHISLCYGNHEIKEKQELLLKLPKLNKSIEMSKIALVEVNEDLKRWKILESFDLI